MSRSPKFDSELRAGAGDVGDVIVQCSDGLYAFVVDEEIRDVVEPLSRPRRPAAGMIAMAETAAGGRQYLPIQIIRVDQTLDNISL